MYIYNEYNHDLLIYIAYLEMNNILFFMSNFSTNKGLCRKKFYWHRQNDYKWTEHNFRYAKF